MKSCAQETKYQKLAVKIYTSAHEGESYVINESLRGLTEAEEIDYDDKLYEIDWLVNQLDSIVCNPQLTKLREPIVV